MKNKHTTCRIGAAVRLHGYAPARVLAFHRVHVSDFAPYWTVDCLITTRSKIGPHGYRPREVVNVRAHDAVPRDIIRVSRQHPGALYWPSFAIVAKAEA